MVQGVDRAGPLGPEQEECKWYTNNQTQQNITKLVSHIICGFCFCFLIFTIMFCLDSVK